MKKLFLFLFPLVLSAQVPIRPTAVTLVNVNVNIQVLSSTVVKSKYHVNIPKGITAASVIAENNSNGTMYIGQGSIVKALRDAGYPALGRTDSQAVIFAQQSGGFIGFVKNELPFAVKLLNDIEGLIVVKALGVSPGVGLAIAATSAVLNQVTPDIEAQIQAFEQNYDADGIQNLLKLSPGDSAIGTIIIDAPPRFVTQVGHSFPVPVPVVQVTGANQ